MSDNPPKAAKSGGDVPKELKLQRETLTSFFRKGAEFTEDLLRDHERLRARVGELETSNALLRTQLASNQAIAELLVKIEGLERERESLVSEVKSIEENHSIHTSRAAEMEQELSNLANLYIASFQLNSSLNLRVVLQHLRELLVQLMGAKSHAYYLHRSPSNELVAVSTDGIQLGSELSALKLDTPRDGTAALIERTYLTGVPYIAADHGTSGGDTTPAACIPLRIEDRVVGVLVIFSLLAQKTAFSEVDFEFFKMIGAHAATALYGALMYLAADQKLPTIDPLIELGL